jgi:glycerophosphoryl diester phosphodiesterase
VTLWGRRDPIAFFRRIFSGSRRPPPGPPRRARAIGHRGAPRVHPENTLASYAHAIGLGADGIEADVCVTKDGVWVLWHDAHPGDLVSMARGIGAEDYPWSPTWPPVGAAERRPVIEMTLDEMRRVCGYASDRGVVGELLQGDEHAGVGFQLLEDLWRWAAGEPKLRDLYLDVKLDPEHAGQMPRLLDAIESSGFAGDVHVLLPQRELLEPVAARPRPPNLHLVPDFELPEVLEGARAAGVRRVSMGYSKRRTWGAFCRELAEVIAARDAGALDHVTVWTINREDRLRFLQDARVDAILTDDLPLLCRLP